MSLSARRAWIEIWPVAILLISDKVALRKESVDRNTQPYFAYLLHAVALRKESVDRNFYRMISLPFSCMSQFSCSSVMPGILFFTSSRFMVETPFCG